MIKNCYTCNKEFETVNPRKRFCSISCKRKGYDHECLYCGKHFIGVLRRKYCSDECNQADAKNRQDRIEATNIQKYGCKNPAQNKKVQEKIKQTNLKKYGNEVASKNENVKIKIIKTNQEKYGYNSPILNKDVIEKVKETNRKNYNHDYASQNEDIKKIISIKNKELSKEYQPKVKETMLKKYGKENAFQVEEFKEKAKETNLQKRGHKYISQNKITNYENYNEEYIKEHFVKDGYFLINEFSDYFNRSPFGIDSLKNMFNITEPNKHNRKRVIQQQIIDFIKEHYKEEIITETRKIIPPLELDIYIPKYNLAIELDGLMYHSVGVSTTEKFNNANNEDKNYHLNKTRLCEEKGIKLFHIFENEWKNEKQQNIWKSKILYELNLINNKIDARKCEIRELNNKDIKLFLEENHLQGNIKSSINLGLFYNNNIVEILTFDKSRFNKYYDYELIRACSKNNVIIRGGFNKLLNYFKSNYKGSIISYGNRRWTSKLGNIYGEDLIGESKPNYFYFHKDNLTTLFSRQSFQKHKLKDKLKIYDETLSEAQNMFNNGYRRIWDCGNLVYEL